MHDAWVVLTHKLERQRVVRRPGAFDHCNSGLLDGDIEQASALAVISRALMLITTLPGALWISPILAGDLDDSVIDVVEKEVAGSS